IYQPSTYFAGSDPEQDIVPAPESKHPDFYHRHVNPTNNQVASISARFESTEDALVIAAGMAAIRTAILSVAKSGVQIVTQDQTYPGSMLFLKTFLSDYGISITHVPQADNDSFVAAIQENTKLIYIETPSNPNLEITDLAFIGQLGRSRGITT